MSQVFLQRLVQNNNVRGWALLRVAIECATQRLHSYAVVFVRMGWAINGWQRRVALEIQTGRLSFFIVKLRSHWSKRPLFFQAYAVTVDHMVANMINCIMNLRYWCVGVAAAMIHHICFGNGWFEVTPYKPKCALRRLRDANCETHEDCLQLYYCMERFLYS